MDFTKCQNITLIKQLFYANTFRRVFGTQWEIIRFQCVDLLQKEIFFQ
jgi:hypothetical protein